MSPKNEYANDTLSLSEAQQEAARLQQEKGGIWGVTGDRGDGYHVYQLSWDEIGPTVCGGTPGMDFDLDIPYEPPPEGWIEPS